MTFTLGLFALLPVFSSKFGLRLRWGDMCWAVATTLVAQAFEIRVIQPYGMTILCSAFAVVFLSAIVDSIANRRR